MASNYHLLVKKSLDLNKTECLLPEYIQRGWKRIYTSEEKELLKRSYIIGPDTQIPNSVVRYRLGTKEMFKQEKTKLLQKAFELPDKLFLNLSAEHKPSKIIDEEKLSFQWTDEDDNYETNRKKSPMQSIVDRQREKRRKFDEYKYDYENLEPLSLEDIIEEIQTNIGKDLKDEDMKTITQLMQIINQHKNNQIINIYDELTNVQLISKFGGVPKIVQALQEIQKAFERVAMKTNIASIETVINVLLEKDKTYRISVELLKSFNENTKKNKLQQNLYLIDRSDDITDHDRTVFDILIKDRISRLPISDLIMLIRDLATVRSIDIDKLKGDRDEQVKYLSEQLELIFTRAHLDGIKTTFDALKSPIGVSLRKFIEKIETSIKMKLTEQDSILIESYIHDYLSTLNENELKIVNERLAQQGTLKRLTDFHELNQAITMGLMKKIDTDGLTAVIENIKEAQIDIHSFTELVQVLTLINQYIQNGSSIALEQIQKQLDMAYFIETRNLNQEEIYELSKAVDLYSIAQIPLSEQPTTEECATFLENLKVPFIRTCIQRTLEIINEENITDLNKVSDDFYKKRVSKLFNELIHGSDELNQNLLISLIREQLKKSKELPDKVYRQLLKDKLIQTDAKVKIYTDKKKISAILDGINQILIREKDSTKQAQLIEIFDRVDISLPERAKQWYKNKSSGPSSPVSTIKTKKNMIKQKDNLKAPIAKTKAAKPPRSHQPTNKSQRVPIATTNTSSKKKSAVKSIKGKFRTSIPPKSKDESKAIANVSHEQLIAASLPSMILQDTKKPVEDTNDQQFPISDELSSPENPQSFQVEIETIQPQTAIEGKMGTNQTISFDLDQTAACLNYHSLLAMDPKQEIKTRQSGQRGELVHDSPYEKTKAQRILATTIDRNTSEPYIKTEPMPSANENLPNRPSIESSSKVPRRSLTKSLKQTEDIYINSLTKSLNNLLTQSKYDNIKLRKIHEELIASGLISPLNEFYRSTNDALRVVLDHCITYDEFIKWTLSLLQTTNKPNLIDFAHDLYSIAIDLDLTLIERIDNARCAMEIQENLKHDLQTISEHDLREINSYINANQLEKVLHTSKKLNVTSKDRMISDLNSLLLHLIQSCHSFETKYRPMQTYIREVSEIFQSRAVADLARKLDKLEKKLSKTFGITFFGLSQRLNDSHFLLIK